MTVMELDIEAEIDRLNKAHARVQRQVEGLQALGTAPDNSIFKTLSDQGWRICFEIDVLCQSQTKYRASVPGLIYRIGNGVN